MAQINTEISGAIGWIIFNSPEKLNSLNKAMWQELPQKLGELEADERVRVIILRGADEKAFSAGADISEFATMRQGDAAAHYNQLNNEAFIALQDCSKPTIAMVQGYCLGGGFLLALSVDLRLASTNAQFSLPPAKLGLGFDVRWISPLMKLIPAHLAKEMLFTADRYDAEAGLKMGFLNGVVSSDDLMDLTVALAEKIGNNAPLTLLNVKRAIDELARNDHHIDFARLDALTERCYSSEDYEEGRRAFAERRPPVFKGK